MRRGLTSLPLLPLAGLLLAASCATFSGPAVPSDGEIARRQADRIVRDARAEASTLRAEMAAARIAAAKQEAEVQALHTQLAELRQTLAVRQQEVAGLRSDRDRLFAARAELQTQAAEIPALRQRAADLQATQARLTELEAALAALRGELAEMKQRPARRPAKARAKSTASAPPPPRVTVQPGDTLFAIAAAQGLSVEALQQANGLSGTQVRVGQSLVLPAP